LLLETSPKSTFPRDSALVCVPFSAYPDWLGLRPGTLPDRDFVRENFGTQAENKSLVQEYLRTRNLPEDVREYLLDLED
jgi:hypothetical protein